MCGSRATGARSATAPPPWRCTCCAARSRVKDRSSKRPGSPRARLFLALDLPDDLRAALVEWRSAALAGRADLRPVAPEALHVTLVFLGYLPEKEIATVARTAFAS